MMWEEEIARVKQRIIEDRIQGNEQRKREFYGPENKKKKPLKLLSTVSNFFVAENDKGFIVMHLDAFMKLPEAKKKKIMKIYR